ncbi:MAG TPA: CPBP family intramembrane metalloprotease [Gammaproteobacteria bacterium]|nr:CPBP family intramembrane metalloprotease [Gammaproteobacteria bacterium]
MVGEQIGMGGLDSVYSFGGTGCREKKRIARGIFRCASYTPRSLVVSYQEKDRVLIKVTVSILLVLASIALIFKLFGFSKAIGLQVSENQFIAGQFRYQALLLPLALFTVIALYILNGEVVGRFLFVGDIGASAGPVPLFGIKEGESWLSLGLSLSFFITLVTAAFMYFQVRAGGISMESLIPLIGWVLLFSLTNSLSEELIFRVGIVSALYDAVSPEYIMIISAVIFGLAHYGGMPSGLVGVFLAGLLGWLLMKSVLETQGIFWAWFIHFLQDVVIFSGLVLLNLKGGTTTAPN